MRYKDFKTFLKEYRSIPQAKKEIIQKIVDMDLTGEDAESNKKLLDTIYTIVNKTGVLKRFSPVQAILQKEYSTEAINDIAEKMASTTRLNIKQKSKFLNNLKNDKVINHNLFLKSGHYNIVKDLCYNDPLNFQMLLEFLGWGAGKSRKGKGEHALAILSQQISVTGLGDINVSGTAVELKVAEKKGSGRLGEGGVDPNTGKKILFQFQELTEPLNLHFQKQKSINIKDFTALCNNIPELNQARRKQIGDAIFGNVFGTHGSTVTNVFQKPNADPRAVTLAYISANFDWYKENPDMGGAWESLTSIGFGSGGLVTVTSGKDLVALINKGSIAGSPPGIVTTQQTDAFFQINPTAR